MILKTKSAEETEALGGRLARALSPKCAKGQRFFVGLNGDLGVGKSSFAKGFIKEWLYSNGELARDAQNISLISPTYNLVRTYGKKYPIAHLDLYRIETPLELEQIDYEQYFYEYSVCLVEWINKTQEFEKLMPADPLIINIGFDLASENSNCRLVEVNGINLENPV